MTHKYERENDTDWRLPYKSLTISCANIVDFGIGYYVYEDHNSIALFKTITDAKTFIDIYLLLETD